VPGANAYDYTVITISERRHLRNAISNFKKSTDPSTPLKAIFNFHQQHGKESERDVADTCICVLYGNKDVMGNLDSLSGRRERLIITMQILKA